MKRFQLVITLLAFIVMMFTLTGAMFLHGIESDNKTTNFSNKESLTTALSLKPICNNTFKVTEIICSDKMPLEQLEKLKQEICIDDLLNTLKNDSTCSDITLSPLRSMVRYPQKDELLQEEYNNTISVLKNYHDYTERNVGRRGFMKFKDYSKNLSKFERISYNFLIAGYKDRCLVVNTSHYCEFSTEKNKLLLSYFDIIKRNLNRKCLSIADYIPHWFINELIIIVKIPVLLDNDCINYQGILSESIQDIGSMLKKDNMTLCKSRVRNLATSTHQSDIISTGSTVTFLIIILQRSIFE